MTGFFSTFTFSLRDASATPAALRSSFTVLSFSVGKGKWWNRCQDRIPVIYFYRVESTRPYNELVQRVLIECRLLPAATQQCLLDRIGPP